MRLFDKEFAYLEAPFLQDLENLEREGAVYSQFWREDLQDFRFCRIRFTPPEIVSYVEASIAFNEFEQLCGLTGDPDLALDRVSNVDIRERVQNYNRRMDEIGQDTHFCFAAFIGPDLESLTCGGEPDRYEYLAETYTGDRRYLLTEILESFPDSVKFLGDRMGNRSPWEINSEQDVRDLLYAIIKCSFADAKLEESTAIHAGGSKRIDIVLPAISTLIEVKYVRNHQHSNKIADELKIDFESYHVHPNCSRLLAYVWDSQRLISDRANFIEDLRGLRTKGSHTYSVEVFVKP